MKIHWKVILGDIRFWIALTFIHRLFSILQPPLEAAHNWRQTTVCMVARNFLEIDANILYPRIDMAGDLSGITGMEFPFLNYLIYLISLIFGYEHWYGRLINLSISSLGLSMFYQYIKDVFNKRLAFISTFLILFSLFYYYSRKIMPDTFSIALIMIGMKLWYDWMKSGQWLLFGVGFLAIFLGVLSKLPSVMVLVFIWPIFKEASNNQKVMFTGALTSIAIVSAYWYFSWVPHLESTFGFEHFFMGMTMSWTFSFLMENWPLTLHMFYQKAVGYSGFFLFLFGLFFVVRSDWTKRFIVVGSILLFMILMLKSGNKFVNHEYYIMPFIPCMAFVGGIGMEKLRWKIVVVLLLVYSVEGVARKWEDQFIKSAPEIENLDVMIAEHVQNNDLIVINSGSYPSPIYFAHRKGWIAQNEQLLNQAFRSNLKSKGCRYALILKKRFGTQIDLGLSVVEDNDLFVLYEM